MVLALVAFLSLIVKNCVFSSPSVVCNCQIIFPVQIHLGFVHFERNFPNGWFHGLFLMKKLFYFFRKIKKKQQPCNAIYCRYWFLDFIKWGQNIFEVAFIFTKSWMIFDVLKQKILTYLERLNFNFPDLTTFTILFSICTCYEIELALQQ